MHICQGMRGICIKGTNNLDVGKKFLNGLILRYLLRGHAIMIVNIDKRFTAVLADMSMLLIDRYDAHYNNALETTHVCYYQISVSWKNCIMATSS